VSGFPQAPAPEPAIAPVAGFWYPNYLLSSGTTGLLVTGQLHAYPFLVQKSHQFQAIGTWCVAAGTTAVLRFGIFADTGQSVPGALVLDAGTTPAVATSAATLAIAQSLSPGLYWATVVQVSAVVGCTLVMDNSTRASIVFGQTALATGGSFTQDTGYNSVATTFVGGLPATFPTAIAAELSPFVQLEA